MKLVLGFIVYISKIMINLNKSNVKPKISKKLKKHFPSPLREWKNSIYVFNKNSVNSIPSLTVLANNIIKSYFSLYNKRLEAKMRTKRLLLRFRRQSRNKYFISNGGFKHTNNRVLINLFVYNRQKFNYLSALKRWYIKLFLKKTRIKRKNIGVRLTRRLISIKTKSKQAYKNFLSKKFIVLKIINKRLKKKNKKFRSFLFTTWVKNMENFRKKVVKKSFRKIKMYFYYKQLLYINKSKLNYTYLQYLKNNLEKLYSKNVEFNIINIKRFYLNSDILSESMSLKISKQRRKTLKFFKRLKLKVIVLKKNLSIFRRIDKGRISRIFSRNGSLLRKYIVKNLRHKYVTGFRLQAKGRLNRRFTASRSMHRMTYKGSLSGLDSRNRGFSSVLLRGNLKSNVQYTRLKSKSRIGSFGIKGWVSAS